MDVFTIANYKGGSCKTTFAVNLSAEWGAAGKRVLLIDLDPIAEATKWLGVEPEERMPQLLMSLHPDKAPLEDGIVQTEFGIDLLPGGGKLTMIEVTLKGHPAAPYALDSAIKDLGERYDIVVLDCPGQFGALTSQAMVAADRLFIGVDLKTTGSVEQGLKLVQQTRNLPGTELGGLLLNKLDRSNITRELADDLAASPSIGRYIPKDPSGKPIVIPEAIEMAYARRNQQPVRVEEPKGKSTVGFAALAKAILAGWN